MSGLSPFQDGEIQRLHLENRQLRDRLLRADERARARQLHHIDRLERAVTASSLAIFDWVDVSLPDIYFTKPVYEVLGHDAYSFTPSWAALSGYVHPRQRTSFERSVAKAIYLKESLCTEVEMICADGLYRWIEVTALASDSDDGQTVRFTGSIRDIDTQHRLRGRVALLSEQLSLVIDAARVGVWDWVDVRLPNVDFSDALLHMLGYVPDQVDLTLDIYWSLIHLDDHEHVRLAMNAALEEAQPFDVEYRIRMVGRGYRYVRSMGKPVKNSRGIVTRLTGSIMDVHERRYLEIQLSEQLEQQRRLNYLMANDLIEPVQHIGAFVDVIREDCASTLTPCVDQYLDVIAERVDRTHEVIEVMLGRKLKCPDRRP